jgi:hypothetical protein
MERLDDTTSATQSVVPPKAGKKVEIVRRTNEAGRRGRMAAKS